MRKCLSIVLIAAVLLTLCACGSAGSEDEASLVLSNRVHFDSITLGFVPSSDSDAIITATETLPEIFKTELAKHGVDVDSISVEVGDSYDATGEAMVAGDVDIGWLPGGTYALYSEDCEVILTATRSGLSIDSTDPADWNDENNTPTKSDDTVKYYRALIFAGPSEYGQTLAEKVNKGESLTWEELDAAHWATQKVSSSAGYIYPNLWLIKNYNKQLSDLSNVTPLSTGYADALLAAAKGEADIFVGYADLRRDYAECWTLPDDETTTDGRSGMGGSHSIWHDIKVIGVTDEIYNDAVAVSKNGSLYDTDYTDDLIKIIQQSLIDIINTPQGKEIFKVYAHTGYAMATDEDYEIAKAAIEHFY